MLLVRASGHRDHYLVKLIVSICLLDARQRCKVDLLKRCNSLQCGEVGKVVVLGEVDVVQYTESLDAAHHFGGQDADKIGEMLYGDLVGRSMSVYYRHHLGVFESTYVEDVDLPCKQFGLSAHLTTDEGQ